MKTNVDKYFDGYVKAEIPKKNGKGTKTEYVYVDDFIKYRMDANAVRIFKTEASVIQLVFAVIYFYASFMDTSASHTSLVGIFSLIMIIPGLFWFDGLINLLFAKELMERRRYRYGSERITNCTKVLIWMAILQAGGEVYYMIFHRAQVSDYKMESLFLLLAVIELAILLFYKKELKKLEIEMVPNPVATEQPQARAYMESQRELKKAQEEVERNARGQGDYNR